MRKLENPENLVGKKFNKLLVLKHLGQRQTQTWTNKKTGKSVIIKVRFYLCRCECGRESEQRLNNLKGAAGCRHCGHIKPNCKRNHPLSGIWNHMVYPNYTKPDKVFKLRDKSKFHVYKRWLLSFEDFVKDVENPPSPKHVFVRIDYNKGYTPENCKWMTRSERFYLHENFMEPTMANLSRQAGLTLERVRQITNNALQNKENKLNKLIKRVDYKNTNKQVIFKPKAIEYFKQKKYLTPKRAHKTRLNAIQYYLKGTNEKTAAEKLNKSIKSIRRYYKIFSSTPARFLKMDSMERRK